MVKVIGIGLACWDYLLQVPDLHTVHHGCWLKGFNAQGGGPVATAMVAIARLGGQAELWTVLGQDHTGQLIKEELLQEGVDMSQTIYLADRPSLFNFVLVDGRTGERVFLSPKLDWRVSGLDVERDWSCVDSADVLLVSGFWHTAALKALRRAREKGIPTCGDIGRIAGNEELLKLIDYLIVPQHAAEEFAGSGGSEALQALSAFGARMVAITLGSQGTVYLADGKIEKIPAFEVEAVDTTGAGDVFHGAYTVGLVHGWNLRQIALFSTAVSAIKCTRLGGRAGIPGFEEVIAFLRARGIELE